MEIDLGLSVKRPRSIEQKTWVYFGVGGGLVGCVEIDSCLSLKRHLSINQ